METLTASATAHPATAWPVRLLSTSNSNAAALLRITLGGVMLPHGYLKITNFASTVEHMTAGYGLPAALVYLVIVIEFFGALLLVLGLGGRLMAAALAAVMLGAIPYHWANGFLMNWFGDKAGEGYEYHLLALALAAVVMALGSGAWSLDRLLTRNSNRS